MDIPDNSKATPTANLPKIDEDLTFAVLISQARRKLLVALARGGPQIGADLKEAGKADGRCKSEKNFKKSTLINLKKMVEAGIVLKLDHGTDGRRVLYSLSPLVKVTKEGEDTVFDFGFFVARLSVDGN